MYEDLERPPLRVEPLARTLAPDGWRLEVLAEVPSTNAVVSARALAGEAAGLVLVAELQTAGRGRLDRSWVSPARAGLTMSMLLRPDLDATHRGWVPLWAGAAVALALREQCGVDAVLKWPNDVLVGGDKVAGLLAEAPGGDAIVVGIGLNVTTRAAELPAGPATSLALAGATSTDRGTILKAVLRQLARALSERDPGLYRGLCSTLGTTVRIHLPGGGVREGFAEAVDDTGRLVVDGTAWAAGDVVHLR